jgi:hypothetical protein
MSLVDDIHVCAVQSAFFHSTGLLCDDSLGEVLESTCTISISNLVESGWNAIQNFHLRLCCLQWSSKINLVVSRIARPLQSINRLP